MAQLEWTRKRGEVKQRSQPASGICGAGSHANYFYPDGHSIYWHDVSIPGVWDDAHGDGVTLNEPANPTLGKNTSAIVVPEVGQSFGGPFAWLQFQGLWGEFTGAWLGAGHVDVVSGERDGSQSPPVQDYWKNAFAWPSESCDGCQDLQAQGTDMEVTAFSPLDIHLYDSQGHHTGKNSDGSIDKQIPGSEYLEYPDLHRKSIIVHGSDISTGYKFEATGNGRGTADLIVTAPDHHQNNVQTLNYNAIQVNPSTKVIMNLDLDKNYMASVDTYGNGAEVMQKAPDKTTTSNVDFTPPAKITDLAVTAITSGTATLTFTAPGDDESTGTATSYDLRYSTSAITDQYLSEATPAADLPAPLQASATQTATVTGLKPGTTYYFAIKAIDKEGLFSPISNIATAITTIPSLA